MLELQNDNERLSDEKDVIFQSLCRQTEKLEDSRSQFETLQKLLLRDPDQQDSASTEREQKLVDLLKGAQEEREGLLMKLEEMNSDLNELKKSLESSQLNNQRLKERISVLESTVDASTADRKEIERELGNAKEESSAKQIEISRLTTLLENARSKIDELEQDRALGDKSDLGELLDGARKEKDNLEVEIATLQEQLSKSQNETLRLRDNLAGATEECKVTRNNAKCALSDLEYKCEQMQQEKNKIQTDYQQLIDTISELQVKYFALNLKKLLFIERHYFRSKANAWLKTRRRWNRCSRKHNAILVILNGNCRKNVSNCKMKCLRGSKKTKSGNSSKKIC